MSVTEKEKSVSVKPIEYSMIKPALVSIHVEGYGWNEWKVVLNEDHDFNIIREHPEVWKKVQASASTAVGVGLKKFDRVTVILADESKLMEARVVSTTGNKVHLTGEKIIKFSTPDSTTGFADETYCAYWSDGGFIVERRSDGVPMVNYRFANLDLAKAHIKSLYPKKMVG